jgi:hypothetical protein
VGLTLPYAKFLYRSSREHGALGRTLMVGRQRNLLTLEHAKKLPGVALEDAAAVASDEYATGFLRRLCRASEVHAIDYSDYEGAERIWDLNRPVPEAWHQQYDTIIDGGTVEHVFQATTALASLMQMLKPGGRLFLFSPMNNLCGHGFYQFSPEFFYRALSAPQGFSVRRMTLFAHPFPSAELSSDGPCYDIADPAAVGGRVLLQSSEAAMVMVEATRERVVRPFTNTPQQSDYTAAWQAAGEQRPAAARRSSLMQLGKNWLMRHIIVQGYVQRWKDASLRNRRSFTPTEP